MITEYYRPPPKRDQSKPWRLRMRGNLVVYAHCMSDDGQQMIFEWHTPVSLSQILTTPHPLYN